MLECGVVRASSVERRASRRGGTESRAHSPQHSSHLVSEIQHGADLFARELTDLGSEEQMVLQFVQRGVRDREKLQELVPMPSRATLDDVRADGARGTPDLGRKLEPFLAWQAPGERVALASEGYRPLPDDEFSVISHNHLIASSQVVRHKVLPSAVLTASFRRNA